MPWPPLALPLRCASAAELSGPPPPGAVLVRPAAAAAHGGLALQVLRSGLPALPCGAAPLDRVLLPPGPSLDDLLAGQLAAAQAPADPEDPALQRLCDYAAQLREGLLPGALPPERSLGGVYLAAVELDRQDPARLLERGAWLLGAALDALRAGRSLLSDDVLGDDDRFARERTYLGVDRVRYERDRGAGARRRVRVGPHEAQILILEQPTSILFRLFAHRDPAAPGGAGFALVLVRRGGRRPGRSHVALLADPTRRLPLGEVLPPLCQRLDAMEAARREPGEAAEPWYDGAMHGHGRLASPRSGTRIPPRELDAVIAEALRAGPARKAGGGRGAMGSTAARGGMVALGLGAVLAGAPRRAPEEAPVARGDWRLHRLPSGPPATEAERQALLARPPRSYALLVAAGAYRSQSLGGLGALRTPWRDACAIRERLVRRFGYRRSDIITLADSPCLKDVAGPPTRQQLLWTVEHLPIRQDDTLLFYYAGHGAIEEEPGGRYGYLQPAGWEQAGLSREDRGLRMRVLAELLRDKVAARHQLLLIDACHSGETAVVRGGDALSGLSAPLRAGWRERPVYSVITAAGSADLALEERLIDSPHPHSLFARALLEALSFERRGGACRLRADVDPGAAPDGVITDGELFKFAARRVPELRAAIEVPGLPEEEQRQVPEWNPWAAAPRAAAQAQAQGKIGEFLLIPQTQAPETCDEDEEPAPCRPAACEAR